MHFNYLLFRTLLLLFVLVGGGSIAVAQSDYSTTYTSSNVSFGTGTAVKVSINGTDYDGKKAGSGSGAGTTHITITKAAKYLHFHAAGWTSEDVTIQVKNGKTAVANFELTSNSGISGTKTTYTFSGDPSTADYYKTITFATPISANTELTLTATSGNRFVIWGINPEEESVTPPTPSADPVTASITSAKYATFSSAKSVDFSTTGITVYTASVDAVNMVVRLTEVADGIVPANTGVILYSDVVKTDVEVPTTTTSTPLTDNEMVATVERTKVPWESDGKYNYIMQLSDGKVVFNMATDDGYMPAGRAYLSTTVDASSSSSGARMLRVEFNESPSGISDIVTKRTDDATYDLLGRRVAVPAKGIYVRGGKKLFIK